MPEQTPEQTNVVKKIKDRSEGGYARNTVIEIVKTAVDKVVKERPSNNELLFEELKKLALCIDRMRSELAESRPHEIGQTHIPAATDELDAIVEATAGASHEIMDACDAINVVATVTEGEAGETLEKAVTRIYEACGFQDITGQRINKVITTLKMIEDTVSGVLKAMGEDFVKPDPEQLTGANGLVDEAQKTLLNGPQLPGQGISQEEIDKLLDSFD